MKQEPVDIWIIDPLRRFMNNSATSGLVLFSSAILALILSNSPWAENYHAIWKHYLSIGYDEYVIKKDLHHWINDGLMAVFFFVVGLELKREIIAGELSNPRNAVLPLIAAAGGMLIPALIYLFFNPSGPASSGWGIPMATDIAFALGILYLLGDKVPVSLKVFLTALAIADDIGAVLVIAIFYTSQIDYTSLVAGAIFMGILIGANVIGVRNTVFYGVVGIGGLWLAFLLSGVHATIAAVLAAFTIPANVKISEDNFTSTINKLMEKFRKAQPDDSPLVTADQLHVLEKIRNTAKKALTPLQRLEHSMHPLVAFVIMPVFAFANAGVTLSGDLISEITSPVTVGIFAGLLLGKVIGVVGISMFVLKMKWAVLPEGMNQQHLIGAGFLSAIGFTMSLFIASLAFTTPELETQAKIGILIASIVAGFSGYFIIRKASR
jgi:Na+:H+ antiporter, NhaA family